VSIPLSPVGIVRTNASEDQIKKRPHDFESESRIEIFPEYQDALDGLQGFSHILILSYLDKLRPDQIGVLKIKPRRLLMKGLTLDELPLVGVFAIDSPTRPNPISMSLVKLLRVDGRELSVSGLNMFDGTPVLDIKPYTGEYRVDDYSLPEWYSELCSKAREHL
jgi:tRNA-Thr(GGU) m(6)t(6)A37 methyltransferase TsaA